MLLESLGYAINNSEDSTEFQKNLSFSRKLQNLSHELNQRLFYQKLFFIESWDYHSKYGNRNWVSAFFSSDIYALLVYWTGVNIITYEKLSGVPLTILSSVICVPGAEMHWMEIRNVHTWSI